MNRSLLNQASLSQYSLNVLSVFSQPAPAPLNVLNISPSGENIMPITTVPYLISPCVVHVLRTGH